MLIKDFYELKELKQISEENYEAHIKLNKEHDIFKGHFPGNPITPGVCMVQILKEIVAGIVDKDLIMKSTNNIKFMALINPEETPDLRLEISISESENGFAVKNQSYFDDTLALKMGAKYEII
ncbi:MAG: 3-hydroxyacyl-ACP dehydratase [Brumimicrobium sp.]